MMSLWRQTTHLHRRETFVKPFTFRSIEKEISFADFTLKNCTIGRLFAHCYSVFVSGDCVILAAYATDNWFSLVYSSSLCCPLFEICLLKSQKSNHFLEPLWSNVSVFNIFTVVIYTIPKLACTQTLFYFSFCSFWKHRRAHKRGEHASEASERKKEFFFPTPASLRWRSINPFFFFFSCVLDGLSRENRGSVNRLSQSTMFSFSQHEFSFETASWYSSRPW